MITPILCGTILVCILTAVHCETQHHWEWVGLFEIDSHTMNPTLILDRNIATINEIKVVVLQSPSDNEGELESLEKEAEALFASDSIQLDSQFASVGAVHKYSVSKDSWAKMISFSFSNAGYYAIFFDIHLDDYCRAEGECFKNSLGDSVHMHWEHSVEDDHSEDHSENTSVRWAKTLEACVIVWTAVFAGVVLLGGGCRKYESIDSAGVTVEYLNMFAAGALLGTAFCLVLTEASHMIATDYGESATSGYWGAMVLLGYISCGCFELLRHYVESMLRFFFGLTEDGEQKSGSAIVPAAAAADRQYELVVVDPASSADVPIGCDVDVEEGGTRAKQPVVVSKEKTAGCCKSQSTSVVDADGTTKGKLVSREVQIEVISTIFIGDFFHNFSDGIFIGAAFQTCSSTVAWTIVLSTVFHEFAQEIADFIVLTKKGNLSILQALAVNAISGLSVVVGGTVISVQEMKQSTIGMLLAFGAGNYIYLAATELYPAFHDFSNPKHKLFGLLLFAVGAAAVGLVLLDHGHCEAESHDAH